MAAIQNKHSVPRAQGLRRAAHVSTKPKAKTRKRPRIPHRSPKKARKREMLPESLRFTVTKRGKTTIRRYQGRRFHRFEEAQGKPLDYIELFTAGEYHSIAVRFQDKTVMHFVIEPNFTLTPEYADLKTGNWRPIKSWPLIRSQPRNS